MKIQKEILSFTNKCKDEYKSKIESNFSENSARSVWCGIKTIMGSVKKPQETECNDDIAFSNELNTFYSRFDSVDFSDDRKAVLDSLPQGDDIHI